MKKQTWRTEFNEVEKTMTHIFSERVKMVVDYKEGFYYVTKDGSTIEKGKLKGFTLDKYNEKLLKLSKSADELEVVSQ